MLTVENLSISFRTDEGLITPVQDVSFSLEAGRTLGLVGESGSGKSLSTKALMQLLPGNASLSAESRIHYQAKDGRALAIHDIPARSRQLNKLRGGEIGMIFQEPMASFSPVYTIGNQIIEAIRLHKAMSKREARAYAIDMLDKVGIVEPSRRIDQYPHEMSGGMRQRAMIALALSAGPALLIADEPTTALDVTIQAQVLELMRDLQREMNMGMIFITHDLGVISQIADDVAVMYQGRIVEHGPVREVICNPKEAYTQRLLDAIPRLNTISLRDKLPPSRPDNRLLEVKNLDVAFPVKTKKLLRTDVQMLKVVQDVSFSIDKGETLGLVGESGSGKTTVGRAILRAIEAAQGQVLFHAGQRAHHGSKAERLAAVTPITADLKTDQPLQSDEGDASAMPVPVHDLSGEALRAFRPNMSLVFQDPYSSLNPRMTVRDIIAEPLIASGLMKNRDEIDARVREIAARCKLDLEHLRRFPHAFSGGQRQRICIARALVCDPQFVVCDESVSALDVSIQAEIISLLKDLQEETGVSFLFISHDLAVVAEICHKVAVLYRGRFVEFAPADKLFSGPRHPYTRALLSAVPYPDPDVHFNPIRFDGNVSHPLVVPTQDGYQIIADIAEDKAENRTLTMREIEPGHHVACYLAEDSECDTGFAEAAQ